MASSAVSGLNSSIEAGTEIIVEENQDQALLDTNNSLTMPTNSAADETNVSGTDFNLYLPLYKAALTNDWKAAQKFLNEKNDIDIISTKIISNSDTALHIAVETGKSNDFVWNLLESNPNDPLDQKNDNGDTALHRAATVGNKEAVVMLVNRNPELLYILNKNNRPPVLLAAIFSQKNTLTYLISKSKEDVNNSPFVGQLGIRLLQGVIASGFIDVALSLVKKYPVLATLRRVRGTSALEEIAQVDYAFPSGECFSWWRQYIYSRIPLKSSTLKITMGDIENLSSDGQAYYKFGWFQYTRRGFQKLDFMLWNLLEKLGLIFCERLIVPCVKSIKEKKITHQQAHELVKFLCKSLESLPYKEASRICKSSIILATKCGIEEVIEVIVETFPTTIYTEDVESESNIFQLAARNRLENVFNLIYQMSDRQNYFYDSVDSFNNNFMHLCAKLAPSHKLNLVSGAALQMQRELQWFKQVEKFVTPSRREWKNKDGDTPKMLFTKEHQELKSQGEKWMKDTANSCTIAAALIATVVYAAAFTIPGGSETSTGAAILGSRVPFILFAVSDTVSLFTSITSLLMFLSILTSRYAEEDFLSVLPLRLCIGLLSLFISITFMMIAFGATLYLVFWRKVGLFLVPVAMLACMPVTSFVFLQFPLLVDVMYSTYGPGIFGKKRDTSLY